MTEQQDTVTRKRRRMTDYEPTLAQWLAAPGEFLRGFLGGLLGPLLALFGSMGLLYLVTKKLPAVKQVSKNDGSIQRAIVLAPSLEARASWSRYGGELRSMLLELKARAQAKARQ
jgi:hypothetical protein